MTQEIVDAVRVLEQEKGIAADTLMDALADALLSAYRKSPGSAKYARVDLDHETGDFRVFELILPAELEEKLLEEAAAEQERTTNPETGERVTDLTDRIGLRGPDGAIQWPIPPRVLARVGCRRLKPFEDDYPEAAAVCDRLLDPGT